MGKCIIFCAAGFDGLAEPLAEDDFVIAADGGLEHTKKLGITPDVVLGDFDSLGFTPEGANVFPVEKDDTDAMLAVRRGLERGCRQFLLYGSLDGPRLDHTVANFQTLQFLADRGASGYLAGLTTLVTHSAEEYSLILQCLEQKRLISLDYDKPMGNVNMSAYKGYPVHGTVALTQRGQLVVDMLDKQGIAE